MAKAKVRKKVTAVYKPDPISGALVSKIAAMVEEQYGSARTVSVLESLKKIHIHNKEVFFNSISERDGEDLGAIAYRSNKTDVLGYTSKLIEEITLRRSRGETDIDLTSALVYLPAVTRENRSAVKIDSCIKMLVTSLIGTGDKSPFVLNIIHPWMIEDVYEAIGIPICHSYWSFVARFLTAANNMWRITDGFNYPRIFLIANVIENVRMSQLKYLARLFNVSYPRTRELFKSINDLGSCSDELYTALAQLQGMSGSKFGPLDYRGIGVFLKDLQYKGMLLTHTQPSKLFDDFEPGQNIPRVVIKKFKMKPLFYELSTFLNNPFQAFLRLDVNCKECAEVEDLKGLVHDAVTVALLKVRDLPARRGRSQVEADDSQILITLTDVINYKVQFVEDVKNFEKELRSYYNRNIKLNIQYDYATATSKFGIAEPEYLRVISDIHTDVNRDRNYIFDFGDDFVINCGDTSGDCETTRSWIKSYMRDGIAVAGNHMGYTMPHPEANGPQNIKGWRSEIDPRNTKNGQISYLCNVLRSGSTKFMSNNAAERYGLIIIGTTLYTDFKLFGAENQFACMMEARRRLNDYRNTYFLKMDNGIPKDNPIRGVVQEYTPETHLMLFRTCLGYIRNRLRTLRNNNNEIPIVIVTHHVPVPYGVADEYKNDPLSAAFASDLRWLIDEHPEIRLWCFGHTHTPFDFIYKETRFVCEPWGYFNENGFDVTNYGKRIPMKDIRSKEPWENILHEEIREGKIKVYKD